MAQLQRRPIGRPVKFGEPASSSIRVRVTPSQRDALERAARENHTDVAGVVRDAVNDYVAEYGAPEVFRGT